MGKREGDAFAIGERATKTCVDCGQVSPPTDEMHTLISMKHGWRCTLATDAAGRKTMVWRCPGCWTKFRAGKTAKG